ncbi:hypothetical protein [Fontibacillus panacisegetis]|nr:hypothetical protein [Fontibacillus panacisegetis]
MKSKSFVLLLSIIFILVGCNSKSGLSKSDIGIKKADDNKTKVVYGMSRVDAEKILGIGEKSSFGYDYEHGVKVLYRDDKVAGVILDEETKGIYDAIGGTKIGMLKSEVTEIYGEGYLSEEAGNTNLRYYYDTVKKSFLKEEELAKDNEEDYEKVLALFIEFDDNGYVDRISLTDHRMAMFLR